MKCPASLCKWCIHKAPPQSWRCAIATFGVIWGTGPHSPWQVSDLLFATCRVHSSPPCPLVLKVSSSVIFYLLTALPTGAHIRHLLSWLIRHSKRPECCYMPAKKYLCIFTTLLLCNHTTSGCIMLHTVEPIYATVYIMSYTKRDFLFHIHTICITKI